MSEEEKEALENVKGQLKNHYIDIINGYPDELEFNIVKKAVEFYENVGLGGKYQELEKRYCDNRHRTLILQLQNRDLKDGINKLNKMINEMARMLVEVPNSVSDDPMTAVVKAMANRDLELLKRQVIDHVRYKVESEEK